MEVTVLRPLLNQMSYSTLFAEVNVARLIHDFKVNYLRHGRGGAGSNDKYFILLYEIGITAENVDDFLTISKDVYAPRVNDPYKYGGPYFHNSSSYYDYEDDVVDYDGTNASTPPGYIYYHFPIAPATDA